MKKIAFLIIGILYNACVFGENYNIEEVEFLSHTAQLSGSIVFPNSGKVNSAVVFVHGSGKQNRNMHWAQKFAAEGIATFVYDKRGAGRSGGEYEGNQSVSEKNINLLADDAIAALNVLRKHHKTRNLPLGLTGISQAGWIVPLAAEKSNEKSNVVDFIVLWSSPVSKVSEEDIFSKFTADLDNEQIPSYEKALTSRTSKYIWPAFLGKDTDPRDSLVKLKIPGLWIFGGNDGSIPVDLSIQRLTKLKSSGLEYDYVLFSNAGHNNMSETFATAVDWINVLTTKLSQ